MGEQVNWRKYLLEFFSIFIGISVAFALQKWNEDRRDRRAEEKTLLEIKNGLQQDIIDIEGNIKGHLTGLSACNYFRKLIKGRPVAKDSIADQYYFLLRDYISIQNKTGYESLKSKGLELIRNDSLRFSIISVYDIQYEILEKLEEQYNEMQFNRNYYKPINDLLSPHMIFDEKGLLIDIKSPELSVPERREFLSYLWRIENNRRYVLKFYNYVQEEVKQLVEEIERSTETSTDF
ncbi:MAG: hypothetical protein AAGG68_02435 [Bacteroidota bacterium]